MTRRHKIARNFMHTHIDVLIYELNEQFRSHINTIGTVFDIVQTPKKSFSRNSSTLQSAYHHHHPISFYKFMCSRCGKSTLNSLNEIKLSHSKTCDPSFYFLFVFCLRNFSTFKLDIKCRSLPFPTLMRAVVLSNFGLCLVAVFGAFENLYERFYSIFLF